VNNTAAHDIGRNTGATQYLDGHLTHVHLIDGQQLTPASFGKTDAVTGEWVPIRYSGTYGTNGFRLAFEDAASTTTIGYDTSGNSNNFTTSGISVTAGTTFDQMLDTPTNGYCILNALSKSSTPTPADAGLSINFSAVYPANVLGTHGVSSGKWYWEAVFSGGSSANGYSVGVGVADWANKNLDPATQSTPYSHLIDSRSNFYNNGVATANATAINAGDVVGIALNCDSNLISYYLNNVLVGSAQALTSGQTWFPLSKNSSSAASVTHTLNFGQRAFAYTPPAGFVALNTANLATPSIKRSRQYFDARLRTGTGAAASVSDLEFAPDLVWIKSRSAATNHNMFDSGRGVQKGLGTNWSGAEYSDANTLTALNSNGYSLGSDASSRGVNINTNTYVDWAWKKGATPGFDVVTFTGNATARTIAHGLGVVPEMMMIRTRGAPTGSEPFVVYHSKLNGGTNPANYYLYSTSTAAEAATAIFFNNTMPTSSVFTVGTDAFVNQSGTGIVAYLFAGVEGFSKFGSYVGNGAADGPFVWCGFRPRFIMLKDRSNVAYWVMIDTVRNTFNVVADELLANTANAENGLAITTAIDVTANGFKIRTSDANLNQSSDNYIFAAFADAPFKYARAR
jgi:hypothetical protein